jgi:hypothetical protein
LYDQRLTHVCSCLDIRSLLLAIWVLVLAELLKVRKANVAIWQNVSLVLLQSDVLSAYPAACIVGRSVHFQSLTLKVSQKSRLVPTVASIVE